MPDRSKFVGKLPARATVANFERASIIAGDFDIVSSRKIRASSDAAAVEAFWRQAEA